MWAIRASVSAESASWTTKSTKRTKQFVPVTKNPAPEWMPGALSHDGDSRTHFDQTAQAPLTPTAWPVSGHDYVTAVGCSYATRRVRSGSCTIDLSQRQQEDAIHNLNPCSVSANMPVLRNMLAIVALATFAAIPAASSGASPPSERNVAAEDFVRRGVDTGFAILNNHGVSSDQRRAEFRKFLL